MKQLYLFLILFSFSTAKAQYATTHYIAPSPWQYWSNANEIVISTTAPGTVTVDLKKSNGTAITSLTLTSGNPISYRFVGDPATVARNATNTVTYDRGLIVEASEPVLVNMRNIASDAPGTTANNIKGNASLVSFGNEGIGLAFRLGYYRSSYTGISGGAPLYSVMAIQDGTTVSLNGTVMTVLNAGQSRLFTATMGALLTADKPIVSNVGTYGDTPQACGGNGEDGTVDQIAPVNMLGLQYMLVRGNGTAGTGANHPEQSTIIASQANTAVEITNYNAAGVQISTSTQVLANAGSFITIHHGDTQNIYSSTFVDADKPVVVYSATAVGCETDVSTVLPIGGCAGSTDIITRKFINYNSGDLPYFGYTILESATTPVFVNGYNMEFATGTPRVQIGNTGFYMLRFTNVNLGNPTVININSSARLTTSIVQQGDGFSMSGFFSAFSSTPEPPTEITSTNTCSVTLATTAGLAPYQWYLEGNLIAGADQYEYTVTESGNYTVIGTRTCGLTAPSAPVYITITPCSDLQVEKEVVSIVGNQATFEITATNNGPVADPNVQVADLLPSGYQLVSATPSTGTYDATSGLWTVGSLASGISATLTVVATINATGDFINTAAISGSNTDIDTTNNTAQAIAQTTSLAFTKAAQQSTYYNIGEIILYDLILTNTGQTTISNITISDSNADAGSINPSVVASLASGQSVTIVASHTITAADGVAGNVTNQATASGENPQAQTIAILSDDPSTAASNDATVTTIVSSADLAITKTNNQTVYVPGTTTTYTITIVNNGPSDATNVIVSDPIPAGITAMTWSGNGNTGTGNLNDAIALLPNGAAVAYQVTIAIPNDYTGDLTNTVSVSSAVSDPSPSCPDCTDIDLECVLPQIQAPSPISECDDATADGLKVVNLTAKNSEILGSNTGLQINYYQNATDLANGIAIATPAAFQTTVAYSQTIIVEVFDASGCKTYTTLEIIISKNPEPLLLLEKTICETNPQVYDVTIYEQELLDNETGTFVSGYFTSLANANNAAGAIQSPENYSIAVASQVLFVRVENASGCFTVSELRLTVIPLVTVNLLDRYPICNDANGNLVAPALLATGLSASEYTFKWYRNNTLLPNTTSSISVTQAGNYTVEVTNNFGCPPSSDSTVVILSNGPENFTAEVVSGYFSDNATVFAQATGTGNFVYWMDYGPEQESGYFYHVTRGEHFVYVKDRDGCGGILSVRVVVIDYPKYFTPNEDTYNDYWNISDLSSQLNSIIYIFDRYGKLITSVKPSGVGWDGNYNGHALPSTDYWFKVIYFENLVQKEFRAHFSLKR